MNCFRFLPVLAALVVLFAVGTSCRAQGNTATVTGIVTDSSGAVIPKTRVVITNVGTNISHEAATNNAGEYTVPLLSPVNTG